MPQISKGSEQPTDGGMLVTRTSVFSGKTRQRVLPVTAEQLAAWRGGELIQRAIPQLTDEDREFLLTGTVQAEWDEAFDDEGME